MTKEELFKRVDRIYEYEKLKENENFLMSDNPISSSIINRENLEKSDDMCNFTLEFLNLLDKYKPNIYTITGGVRTFGFDDSDKRRYISANYFRDTSMLRCSEEELDVLFNKIYLKREAAKKYIENEGRVFDIEKIGEFLVSNSEIIYYAANLWTYKGWRSILYRMCLSYRDGHKANKKQIDYSSESGMLDILWIYCKNYIDKNKLKKIFDDVSNYMIDCGIDSESAALPLAQHDVVENICEFFAEQSNFLQCSLRAADNARKS